MKKALLVLPLFLFSLTACNESTIGRISKIRLKDITEITITRLSSRENDTYIVNDEDLILVGSEILNFQVKLVSSPCKCKSPTSFTITAKNLSYEFEGYSFRSPTKTALYESDSEKYAELVDYAIKRSVKVE